MAIISLFYIADFEFSFWDDHGHHPDTCPGQLKWGPCGLCSLCSRGFFCICQKLCADTLILHKNCKRDHNFNVSGIFIFRVSKQFFQCNMYKPCAGLALLIMMNKMLHNRAESIFFFFFVMLRLSFSLCVFVYV